MLMPGSLNFTGGIEMATFRSRSRSAASARSRKSIRRSGSPLPAAPAQRPFFTAIEDLNRGAVPDNEQLKGWLAYLESSLAVPMGELSPAGRQLVRDLQEAARLLRQAIDAKNGDQLLQRFFTHARLASRLALRSLSRTSGRIQIVKEPRRQVYLFGARDAAVTSEMQKARKEATKEVRSLYRLLQLMIASPDVRSAFTQLQDIVRIVFPQAGRGAGGQQRVKFSTEGTQFRGDVEKSLDEHRMRSQQSEEFRRQSALSGSDLDRSIERLRSEVRATESGISELEGGEYRPMSLNVREQTTSEGEWVYMSEGQKGTGSGSGVFGAEQRKGFASSEQKGFGAEQKGFSGETTGIRRLGGELQLPDMGPEQTGRLPIFQEEREEEPRMYQQEEEVGKGKERHIPMEEEQRVPGTGGLSEGQKDEVVRRMRALFKTISGNDELRKSVRDALRYATSLQTLTTSAVAVPAELQYEENLKAAQRDLLLLMERFSGGQNLSRVGPLVQQVQLQMAQDYELKDFVGDWQAFLRRSGKDVAYVDSEEFAHRAKFLVDRSQALGRQEKYSQPFAEMQSIFQAFTEGWKVDPTTSALGAVLQRIVRQDIMQSSTGQTGRGSFLMALMRPDLMQDFRHVLLPSFLPPKLARNPASSYRINLGRGQTGAGECGYPGWRVHPG